MLTEQLQKIENFYNALSPESLRVLEENTIRKSYKAGDLLLQQGQVCRYSHYLLNGLARKYYLNDGKEVTTEFYFENDIAVSLTSYLHQRPSTEIIEILQPSEFILTTYKGMEGAQNLHPELIQLDLLLTEYHALWLEQRLFNFHTLSATERYQKLRLNYPHVIQKIQLTHIASYLGISLETLSRIRAKI